MRRTVLLAVLSGSLASGQGIACACAFQKVDITPVTTENGDTYHGIAGSLEVVFNNDVRDHAVTQFPEPPMTLRQSQPAGECVVDDGGVWGRDDVWLSADGRTLVTTEASGSAADLVFRDTRSCAKVATLDVAGLQWRAQGKALVLRSGTGKGADRRVPLDAACRPVPARKKTP